ncbi:MAG: tRNA (N(6)-L-threonylcarbamoyladenosine(37)-C(2))-methylthiotransferase MtaB [Candidatus Tectomicrobia bacterium]|uniref:Threonylcarbamoyladenosine tRNA methylthiotransferase MtaB n=1 Tax=Tectimicrobiota bacterium TaxID=2528274 RepID=A0A932GPP4_UNCTE|nr:tRNA (N(6)-L-threonylcarbamoyladenosine(37)-C(2))-methylthiotransferase MtaB [Candidatus Tectomicrobia bacterium]
MSGRISLYTLGCRLNQAETALIGRSFQEKGFTLVPFEEAADLCVINTCSVTESAEAKCRNLVRSLLRRSPRTFVALTGCYAQIGVEKLKQIPGLDLIAGNEFKMKIADYISSTEKLLEPVILHTRKMSTGEFTLDSIGDFTERTRANIKIQDGCNFFCSFCIIPYTRGRERSRKFEDILREAQHLADSGYKEVVLTGVNMGRYESAGKRLVDVVGALEKVEGIARIRLASVEPTTIGDELIRAMGGSEKICRHLHLPIQSGDDRILEGMRRRYSVAEYSRFVEKIAREVPGVGIGTDVITGFPGEGEEEFSSTRQTVVSLPFSYLHVFSYSPRPGTRAVTLTQKVHPNRIKERTTAMREISVRMKEQFARRHVGKVVSVLFEQREEDGWFSGLADNYMKVGVMTRQDLSNQLLPVEITDTLGVIAVGRLVSRPAA